MKRRPKSEDPTSSSSSTDPKKQCIIYDRLRPRNNNSSSQSTAKKKVLRRNKVSTYKKKKSSKSAGAGSSKKKRQLPRKKKRLPRKKVKPQKPNENKEIQEDVDAEKSLNINNLPEDVFIEIFRYLTQTELCRVGRVCKRWYEITKSDILWLKVDIKVKFEVCVNNFENIFDALPASVIRMRLEYINCVINFRFKFQLLLSKLKIRGINLQTLILHTVRTSESASSIIALCTHYLPNLRILAFNNCEIWFDSVEDKYKGVSKIEILDVYNCLFIYFRNIVHLQMPYLRKLCLAKTQLSFLEEFVPQVSLHEPNYEANFDDLDMEGTVLVSSMLQLIKTRKFDNLIELYLCDTEIRDYELTSEDLINMVPQLQIICLKFCRYITGVSVLSLIQSLPNLNYIYVDARIARSVLNDSLIPDNVSIQEIMRVNDLPCCHFNEKNYMN